MNAIKKIYKMIIKRILLRFNAIRLTKYVKNLSFDFSYRGKSFQYTSLYHVNPMGRITLFTVKGYISDVSVTIVSKNTGPFYWSIYLETAAAEQIYHIKYFEHLPKNVFNLIKDLILTCNLELHKYVNREARKAKERALEQRHEVIKAIEEAQIIKKK